MEANIYLVQIPKNLGIPGGTWAQAVGQRPREVPISHVAPSKLFSESLGEKQGISNNDIAYLPVDVLPSLLLSAESQLDSTDSSTNR